MRFRRNTIVGIGILVEGSLVAIFFAWKYWRGYSQPLLPSFEDLLFGVLFCLPLLIVNYVLFGPLSSKLECLQPCLHFKENIVRPLAAELDYRSALIVSVSAGVGEELFFRGVLQNELGLLAASVLFAFLHFGPAIRDYVPIGLIYWAIGLYFGWMVMLSAGNLWPAMITHALYDFVVIVYMRYYYRIGIRYPYATDEKKPLQSN